MIFSSLLFCSNIQYYIHITIQWKLYQYIIEVFCKPYQARVNKKVVIRLLLYETLLPSFMSITIIENTFQGTW